MNAGIAKSMHGADGVIYQSVFSKNMCNRYLGKYAGPSEVIFNGADPVRSRGIPPKTNKKRAYITVARWRPHKRLEETIEAFKLADVPNSVLWVAGVDKGADLGENVVSIGKLQPNALIPYYRAAKALIHLCPFDSCPNSVVEAVCAGCPVICTNTGGTQEIADGTILNLDKWDGERTDVNAKINIDLSLVANAIKAYSGRKRAVRCKHVDIRNTAIAYMDFFKKVLIGKKA